MLGWLDTGGGVDTDGWLGMVAGLESVNRGAPVEGRVQWADGRWLAESAWFNGWSSPINWAGALHRRSHGRCCLAAAQMEQEAWIARGAELQARFQPADPGRGAARERRHIGASRQRKRLAPGSASRPAGGVGSRMGPDKSGRYWNRTSDSYRVKVVLYL